MEDNEKNIGTSPDIDAEIEKLKAQEAAAQARLAERLAKIKESVEAASIAQEPEVQDEPLPDLEDIFPVLPDMSAEQELSPIPPVHMAENNAAEITPAPIAEKYKDELSRIQSNKAALDEQERRKRIKIMLWSVAGICTAVTIAVVLWVFFGGNLPQEPGGEIAIEEKVLDVSSVFSGKLADKYYPADTVFPDGIQEKYKHLYAADDNFAGWLNVPGTSIDAPIYQVDTPDDNEYYIKRDLWSGEWSRYGTSFLDYRADIKNMSRNTVIYGHNFDDVNDSVYDDRIFGELEQYRILDFYKENPVIEFNTLYKDYKWKVIACFLTNGSKEDDNNYVFYYIAPDMNDASFSEFVDEISQRSYIHTGVDVEASDKILTLSTCTYFFNKNGRQNARSVVIARMIRDGEGAEVDVSKAVMNENIRYPQLYYKIFGGTNPYANAKKWYAVN